MNQVLKSKDPIIKGYLKKFVLDRFRLPMRVVAKIVGSRILRAVSEAQTESNLRLRGPDRE